MFKTISSLILFIIMNSALSASPFQIIYHGSPNQFDQVEPRPNTRFDNNGNISWQGEAIFGTHDYRIALYYTNNSSNNPYLAGKYHSGTVTYPYKKITPSFIASLEEKQKMKLSMIYGVHLKSLMII